MSTANFHIHEDYRSDGFDNDIAVITLPEDEVELNDDVNIACLPTGSIAETTDNCYSTGLVKILIILQFGNNSL